VMMVEACELRTLEPRGFEPLAFRSSDKKRRTKGYDDSCESH
jgi:hypothetical protein